MCYESSLKTLVPLPLFTVVVMVTAHPLMVAGVTGTVDFSAGVEAVVGLEEEASAGEVQQAQEHHLVSSDIHLLNVQSI